MNYTLKRKDLDIAFFHTEGQNIAGCIVDKMYEEMLPIPLKRLIKPGYKDEFVEIETGDYYQLNEDGCFLFNEWLSNREVPINRYNYEAYIQKDSSPRKWLLENNGYSFTDCYFIVSEHENLNWDDIRERLNTVDVYYSVKKEGRFYKGQNATLGGQLEKFWYKKDDELMLCKKIDMQYDILVAREVVASYIYDKQEYKNHCSYRFVKDRDGNLVGCTCKAFTSEEIELVSAYELLEEYNMSQLDDVWERIVELASNYGADTKKVQDYMDMQAIIDFLITNRDRHQGNIGFLRDANTLQIIGPAPIFDSGSSKYMEGTAPEHLTNTTVNGLYKTELECLQHVRNFDLLDIDKLPTRSEIEELLSFCRGLTEIRKDFLLNRYEEKKEFLRELQQEYLLGTDMQAYLDSCKSNDVEAEQDIFDGIFNL